MQQCMRNSGSFSQVSRIKFTVSYLIRIKWRMMASWVARTTRHHVTSLDMPFGPQDANYTCDSEGEKSDFLHLENLPFCFFLEISPCPFYQIHSGHMGISGQRNIRAVQNGAVCQNSHVTFRDIGRQSSTPPMPHVFEMPKMGGGYKTHHPP